MFRVFSAIKYVVANFDEFNGDEARFEHEIDQIFTKKMKIRRHLLVKILELPEETDSEYFEYV